MRPLNTSHQCPGRCGSQVPRHLFACRPCWYRLPGELRQPITDNHRRNPEAHFAAMQDAIEWYSANQAGGGTSA